MKPQRNDRLREMQLAYLGKLMAGLSHESKNHLAIISESSGLIEDLLMLEEEGQPRNKERYLKIVSGINERVAQAAEMCRFLSGFSHRMDQPLSSFSVTDVLLEIIYLMRRFAHQKQVVITSSFEEDLPAIFNDPSLLQFAAFCILCPALESLEKDGRISISVARRDSYQDIIIHLTGAMKEPAGKNPWQEILPEAMQILGAELSRRTEQDESEELIIRISSFENSQPNTT